MKQTSAFAQRACSMLGGAFFVGALVSLSQLRHQAPPRLPSPRSTSPAPRLHRRTGSMRRVR